MTNKELKEKYPFLIPRKLATDEIIEEPDFCLLKDEIPEGWWNRFGIPLCDDLKDVLERNNFLDQFRIFQAKEKYGELRIYDGGAPKEWYDHLYAWAYISRHTCIKCGKFPVPMRTEGYWIEPLCEECAEKLHYNEIEEDFDKPEEFLYINTYVNGDEFIRVIDMKPFYKTIGYEGELKVKE